MYLRTTTRRASDGSVVRYVQLAHNRRVNGVTQAHVLINLGREEHLDVEGLRRLVGSIRRRLGELADPAASGAPDSAPDCAPDCAPDSAPDGAPGGGRPAGSAAGHRRDAGLLDQLRVVDVRPLGMTWLLDGLWSSLGVGAALRAGIGRGRWTSDVDRIAFACVAVRAVRPTVAAVEQWVTHHAALPGLETMAPGEVAPVLELVGRADVEWHLDAGPRGPRGHLVPGTRAAREQQGAAVLGWLAAVLVEVVEARTGLAWVHACAELDRLCAVTVVGAHGTLVGASEPTPAQLDVFGACGVDPPPRTLGLTLA